MDRRKFLRNGSLAGLGLSSLKIEPAPSAPKHIKPPYEDGAARDAGEFPFLEATIDILQQKMQSGEYTSQSITKIYLKRIAEIDKKGPALNAIIELNPEAITIAERMDAERKAGKVRGPLHGIPVLVKDNINTGDKIYATTI